MGEPGWGWDMMNEEYVCDLHNTYMNETLWIMDTRLWCERGRREEGDMSETTPSYG